MSVYPAALPTVRPAVRSAFEQGSGGGAASIIAGLFSAGQQGFWLPFTDFASLTQDSAGTLPYTALEQPVGLIYDKSRGGALSAEMLTNGNFATDSGWVKGVGWTIVGGKAYADGTNVSTSYLGSPVTTEVGKIYEVAFDYIVTAGRLRTNGAVTSTLLNAGSSGRYQGRHSSPFTGTYNLSLQAVDAGTIATVWNVTFKEVLGNHASQVTSTARGVVSARVNLLGNTGAFTDAMWAKIAAGTGSTPLVTDNYGLAPDGTMTAGRIRLNLNGGVGSTSNISQFASSLSVQPGVSYTQKCWIKSLTANAVLSLRDDGAGVANQNISITTAWQAFEVSGVAGSAASKFGLWLRGGIGTSDSADFLLWHPSMTLTSQSALPFQSVNTPTDYDSVGFPKYLRLDGTDDFYTCGGGGSTTGFYYSDVIRPMGGAGTRRVIWSDRSGNNGYELAINASDKLEFSAGNGAAITTLASTVSAALSEGKQYEVFDNGTVLSVQIDGSAPVTVARPVVTAGSPTITLYRGASTGYFNGQATEPIYRAGPPPSASERATIMGYQKQKAGL